MLDYGSWDIRCDFSCIVPSCTLCKLSLDQWMVHVFLKLHGLYVHVAARPPRPPRCLTIVSIQTTLNVDLVVEQNLFGWQGAYIYKCQALDRFLFSSVQNIHHMFACLSLCLF